MNSSTFTEDILIDINTVIANGDDEDAISFTAAGTLTCINDSYVLAYDDEQGSDGEPLHTEVTVENETVSIVKSGDIGADLFFKPNTPFATYYSTPFGILELTVIPTMVRTDMGGESGGIELEYLVNIAGAQTLNRLRLSYKKDGSSRKGDTK